MFSKIFTFSNATLFVALALSSIAAWYSIIGLAAIFAGAVIPIIIMGSALELAKITTTVWLRKYWTKASWILKLYLVPAVILLALLTSMGIFGFLSKAHLDQGVPTGDVQAKVSLLDEKIKTERDNIETSRKALQQMDAQVDQMLGRTDSDKGAERAVAIRRQQAKERSALQGDIAKAQAEIKKLNEERAPIASELRKVEAEVGPIKYIAALIYGDNPDSNVLERAVRWVIILLVIVFDPLALVLVIGANQSREWDKEEPQYEQDDGPINEEALTALREVIAKPEESDPTINCYKCNTVLIDVPGIGPFCPNKECDVADNTKGVDLSFLPVTNEEEEVLAELAKKQPVTEIVEEKPEPTMEELMADTVEPEPIAKDDSPNFEGIKDITTGEWVQTGPAFVEPKEKLKYVVDSAGYVSYKGRHMPMSVFKELYPEFSLQEDNGRKSSTNFGITFPNKGRTGDVFVRVDIVPNRVYKYNGIQWIETQRTLTDTHLSNEYLKFLVDKISSGEYDPSLLSENEQDAVQNYIKNQNA
jgi:hypothetical protein